MKIKRPPVDHLFRAFADRTRLRIVHLLTTRELCVCDLVEVLAIPQPTASRHLAYLRKSGLVLARKQGLWSYYRLAPTKGAFHAKLLECLACCFGDLPELAADAKKLPRVRKARACCDAACCDQECC